MKVFVTGASGFVGSAVVKELIHAGHEVLGLARSEEAAKKVSALGAKVHSGGLDDLESLKSGAAASDGVIHTAFKHDFSKFKEGCEHDRLVIAALGSGLAGSERPLIVTSAIGVLTSTGKLLTEEDRAGASMNPRKATEEAVDALVEKGIRASVIRLPPSVHGEGDYGFIPILIKMAREKGLSVYRNQGQNRWPAVHRFDAARLYRLALEKSAPGGTRFHAVAEEGIAFQEIAQRIGEGLHVRVASMSADEAAAHFTWFAHFAGMDCASSSKITQQHLDWKPSQPGLLEDLDGNSYFKK